MILPGLLHVINCGVTYTLVAAGSHSVLRTRPDIARTVGQVSGAAMTALAALLLAEQFFGQ